MLLSLQDVSKTYQISAGNVVNAVRGVTLEIYRGEFLIITGRSGSGKTTLLNALSAAIRNKERLITIEDAAELQLQQPHVVRLETRPHNI